MKTKTLILLAIPIVVIFSASQSAHGLWLPQSPTELLEKSHLIFVGTITSVNSLEFEQSNSYEIEEDGVSQTIVENYTLVLDEYTVSVDEFVKNHQDIDTITVRQPTISIPGRIVPHGGFDIGDRVLFYIENFDGTNTYSKESFKIPEHCDAVAVVQKPRMIGGDLKMMQEGMEKQDNFTAKYPVMFISQMDLGTLSGASLEYDVYISKQVDNIYKDIVFHEKITSYAKPCEWLSVAKWEFTPDTGNYLVNGRIYKEDSNLPIGNQFFSVFAESPLKQFKSGVPADKIQCNDDFVLLKKYNGFPACVKQDSVIDLIKRNWMTTDQIDGYAIDYDGDVKHLPFADICTNEMRIILLTHSNIRSPEELFVMEDVALPSRMNQEDFEQCARETDFTKSRWNMVSLENPEPEPSSLDEKNLTDARNKLREVYHANASFGPFTIKEAIVGYGMGDGFLVVDILEDYYDSDEYYQLIIQKIIDITGGKVDIEFNSSGAIVPTHIESIFPHIWNGFLHRNGIEFTPKDQPYANNDVGYDNVHRVCSPVVTSNGTELYISSVFVYEPFEITGTFIDKIKPDDCYKVWKTDTVLEEPDRILMLWLENYHKSN